MYSVDTGSKLNVLCLQGSELRLRKDQPALVVLHKSCIIPLTLCYYVQTNSFVKTRRTHYSKFVVFSQINI